MSAIPLVRPQIGSIRQHAIARNRAVGQSVQSVAVMSIAFLLIALGAYGFSSLAGQTMMEQARREGIRAQERARQARMDVALLRQRVDRLTSMKSIEAWAESRGMQTPEGRILKAMEAKKVDTVARR